MPFLKSLPAAIDALGTSRFEKLLAEAVGAHVDHDFITMARYSSVGKPCFLIHSHTFSPRSAELYLSKYVDFDPYADHWITTHKPGVVWLQEIAGRNSRNAHYRDVFLPKIGVSDEIGVLMPAVGNDSIAFFLNRRTQPFTNTDVDAIGDLYATVAAIYRQHVRALLLSDKGAAQSPSLGRPMRVTDSTGSTIWVTNEWEKQRSPETVEICTTISGDFGVPDRFLWTFAPSGAPDVAKVIPLEFWGSRIGLTPRESDIVALALQGFGSIGIADRLKLSVGNIKNHKRRIYKKLDITSERELFLMYIDAMGAGNTPDGGVPDT